ncbi:MAG TPA: DUF4157 domain-containing protein [Flavobacteriales bacterium]|nr:DUF4157 domain-containing protein [Flavobacteriales bacterium]
MKTMQAGSNIIAQRKSKLLSSIYFEDNRPVQKKENNTGLPDNLKTGIENLSGHSMDDVKVHYNSSQPAQLNAHAFAQGNQIHVAPGQEKHLPHEAWHVVQQKQGRVKATRQLKGKVNINDDAGLEKEADVMGVKALQMKNCYTPKINTNKSSTSTAQLKRHKPAVGSQVSYPATGPGQGAVYNVIASADNGDITIQSGPTTHNLNWKNDNIWIERPANALDIDRRQDHNAWAGLTKVQKKAEYDTAKQHALNLLKAYVTLGMLNATNRNNLNLHLTLANFNKVKKGEWVNYWEEPDSNGRKWKLTIDMDDPLETSDQEPHVGWEVKLENRGTNHANVPYANYAKGQGHVWLNEVPEHR